MRVYRYRLTMVGWIGAILLVAPPPAAFLMTRPERVTAGKSAYLDSLNQVTGGAAALRAAAESAEQASVVLMLAATLVAIGLIMLLVGREIREE